MGPSGRRRRRRLFSLIFHPFFLFWVVSPFPAHKLWRDILPVRGQQPAVQTQQILDYVLIKSAVAN